MYRKFKGEAIFDGNTLLPANQVLVLLEDGTLEAIVPIEEAGDEVREIKAWLTPGFINCHCHIELSYLKGIIPQGTGLVDFVQQVMARRDFPDEIKLSAMRAAARELFEGGTVAVGDICNSTDSLLLKQDNPLFWHNFIEVSGFVDRTAESRLRSALEVKEAFVSEGLPATIVPHSPYSVSKALFELLNAQSQGEIISIHNQESPAEDPLYLNKSGDLLQLYEKLGIDIREFSPTGKSSFSSWRPYFNNGQRVISVHNTFISAADLALANQVSFCLCIQANRYIENALPPVGMLLDNKAHIVIGTDSYASNTSLNMLEEMKSLQMHHPFLATEVLLKWATSNGAASLGITDRFGSFTVGTRPGVIAIEHLENNKLVSSSVAIRLA